MRIAADNLRTAQAVACATIGITATILWCKLMGHSPGFLLATAGLGDWANARVFWLVGILLCSLLCVFLPQSMNRSDAILQNLMPLIVEAAPIILSLSLQASATSGLSRGSCSR